MSSDAGSDAGEPERTYWVDFTPLEVSDMPSSRLQDIITNLNTKKMAVLNCDAVIPTGALCAPVLQTVLFKLPSTITTLSLRFNTFTPEAIELLVEWINNNSTVEMLYLMSCNLDERVRTNMMTGWKKNLFCQRTDNFGFTFIRIPEEEQEEDEDD